MSLPASWRSGFQTPRSFALGRTCGAVGIVLAVALLAGLLPITVSIVAVFLFAGPHNWLEAQYFLTRMPARWGRLTGYFTIGLGGVVALSAAFLALSLSWSWQNWSEAGFLTSLALWQTALILWIATLLELRTRQNPRRDWPGIWPVAALCVAGVWTAPVAWSTALVFIHPSLGLWYLDRELVRLKSPWKTAYRTALLAVPVCLALLLTGTPSTLGSPDVLTQQIQEHAGVGVIPGIAPEALVAAHVFLELLHYLVWIVAIPGLTIQQHAGHWPVAPLARRSQFWRRAILLTGIVGGVLVAGLWIGFSVDYATMRPWYFLLAIGHVLAEVPFLLRQL